MNGALLDGDSFSDAAALDFIQRASPSGGSVDLDAITFDPLSTAMNDQLHEWSITGR